MTRSEDKLPVFILADRGSEETYLYKIKIKDDSTIRLLLGSVVAVFINKPQFMVWYGRVCFQCYNHSHPF
jgi:hypothetical protein